MEGVVALLLIALIIIAGSIGFVAILGGPTFEDVARST